VNSEQAQALEKARKHLHNAYNQLAKSEHSGPYDAEIVKAKIDTLRALRHTYKWYPKRVNHTHGTQS
jgi:cytochrome c556